MLQVLLVNIIIGAREKMMADNTITRNKKFVNFKAIGWLAAAGVAVSAYLTWIHWNPNSTACTGFGDCETVNSSAYATIGEIPIAILGLVMYISLVALAWVGNRAEGETADKSGLVIFAFSLLGVLFSGYLTFIELYVIHAICPWCVTSAVIVTLIFILSLPVFLKWMRGE